MHTHGLQCRTLQLTALQFTACNNTAVQVCVVQQYLMRQGTCLLSFSKEVNPNLLQRQRLSLPSSHIREGAQLNLMQARNQISVHWVACFHEQTVCPWTS